jgi:cell filamentation protein
MYDAVSDPYCYEGTTTLKNVPGIRDQSALNEFEAAMTAQRSDEPLPGGRLSLAHYRAIHRHLFQDVYSWAGEFRTVRIGKGGSAFCYPEHIDREMQTLFADLRRRHHLRNLSAAEFATKVAEFLSVLNAIHPFREGNGRTQTTFLMLLADRAGHPIDVEQLVPERFLSAMIASFDGNEQPLESELRRLVGA